MVQMLWKLDVDETDNVYGYHHYHVPPCVFWASATPLSSLYKPKNSKRTPDEIDKDGGRRRQRKFPGSTIYGISVLALQFMEKDETKKFRHPCGDFRFSNNGIRIVITKSTINGEGRDET
eukprot:g17138.t1